MRLPTPESAAPLEIDVRRIQREIDALAAFSDAPAPAVTRILWTRTDQAARDYLKALFRDAGLEVREDVIGNTFARWQGTEPELAPVATGSHVDAIPHSGRYDGTVGVLGALEAIRALRRAGVSPRRSLELILFTAEEPTRFGIGCLGSRALSGALLPDTLRPLTDENGLGFETARRLAGCEGDLESLQLSDNCYRAFIELHIEQGPLLEREGMPIGVVTDIAAPATLRVALTGQGGHAGAVLMPDRKDALTAAASLILLVEDAARRSGSRDTVATVGSLRVHPGAVNSIPSRVEMEIDVRDIDLARRDYVIAQIKEAVQDLRRQRGVLSEITVLHADPPAACAPAVLHAIEKATEALSLPARRMVSRAYHDTLFMARLVPVGMIFIPCRGGVSHRPDEYAAPEDIARGVSVLAHTLARLTTN